MTSTDRIGPNGWGVQDEISHFREWGTGFVHPLPPKGDTALLGGAADCWLRLWDPSGGISRHHAELTYCDDGWTVTDLSKNGVFLDGVRLPSFSLTPGAEIQIGPITLIAESPRLVALRELLERLIGWADERREIVDQALCSVRIAATRREPLLLCGASNLVPIARQLHHHALGDRPFIVCKPGTPYASGMDALDAAAGGTLCVSRRYQPDDLDAVVSALRTASGRALLMVCAHARPRGGDIASQIVTVVRAIVLPPLAHRARELPRLIEAYAADAIAAFGGWISPTDRQWVAENAASSLHEIATATRRIVALHACGEAVTPAAKLLGMSHGALSTWFARRSLPGKSPMAGAEDEDDANEPYADW